MDIILVRHGKTFANEKKIFGTNDVDLTAEGISELKNTASLLKKYSFEKIIISEYPRTYQTLIALGLGDMHFVRDARINEFNFGVLKGTGYELMSSEHRQVIEDWNDDLFDYKIPEGESLRAFVNRVKPVYDELLESENNVLMITHDGVIRAFLCSLFGDISIYYKLYTLNGSITVIRVENKIPRLFRYNEY